MRICQPPENSEQSRVKSFSLETEALEHGFDARFHARRVGGVELEFESADFLQQLGIGRRARVELGEFVREAVDFFAQGEGFAEGGLGFLPKRAAADVDAFLRQVADAGALGRADLPAAGRLDAGDALHQRGLARAVVAGEGDALARLHGERQVVEEHARAEFDAQ